MQRKSPEKPILSISGLPTRFRLIRKLGQGAYGSVYAAKDIKTNKVVAIKVIQNLFNDLIDAKRVLREICLLRQMNSPYIVKMLECNYLGLKGDFSSIYIVMEYHRKDLRNLMKNRESLTMEEAKKLIYNMLCGVMYLHSWGVCHRDIKPANILVDEDFNVKICDFGLSRSLIEGNMSIAEFEQELYEVEHSDLIDERIKRKYTDSPMSDTQCTDEADLSLELSDAKMSPNKIVTSNKIKLAKVDTFYISPDTHHSGKYNSSNAIVNAYSKLYSLKWTSPNPPSYPNDVQFTSDLILLRFIRLQRKLITIAIVKKIPCPKTLNKPKKKLTSHVVTRWYRSPELILMEQNYDYGVDTWAVGWVIGEILKMVNTSSTDIKKGALFPGYCCYPLSPADKDQSEINGFPFNNDDQLYYIFETLGSPDPKKDLSFLSDKEAIKYAANLSRHEKKALIPILCKKLLFII
jgi:serine/threonine protein kinase